MDLVHEVVATAVDLPIDEVTDLHSTIWEDNVGALTLAHLELPRMTPDPNTLLQNITGSVNLLERNSSLRKLILWIKLRISLQKVFVLLLSL